MCVLAAWQLAYHKPQSDADVHALAREPNRLGLISLAGLAAAIGFAVVYLNAMEAGPRAAILGPAGRFWIGGLIVGIVAQAGGWLLQRRLEDFKAIYLAVISVGCALTLAATTSLRELIRLSQVDLTIVAAQTADAWKIRGFVVFLIFAGLNALLIGLCIWLVKKGFVAAENSPAINTEEGAGSA
jgi:hypothetical protein